MKVEKTVKKRRLIYVDASGKDDNTQFTISMYDPDRNATHILALKDISDNNIAEGLAVFYAIFYIKKHNYSNCHILCDNQSAVHEKYIVWLCKKYKIGISWIPREANIVADKVAKLEPTLKEKDWHTLKLFVDLVMEKDSSEIVQEETKEIENLKIKIEQLKSAVNTRNEKISSLTNNSVKGTTQNNSGDVKNLKSEIEKLKISIDIKNQKISNQSVQINALRAKIDNKK